MLSKQMYKKLKFALKQSSLTQLVRKIWMFEADFELIKITNMYIEKRRVFNVVYGFNENLMRE